MVNIREKIDEGWVRCNVIIEVLGRPAEYLNEILKKAVENMEKEKTVIVLDKKFNEPVPIEQAFSTFTELELLVKGMETLIDFVIAYMPSNIEIIEPQNLKLSLHGANDFINKLTAKIHQYDAFAKRTGLENQVMRHRLQELGEIPKEIEEMEKVLEENKKIEEEDKKSKKK